MHENKNKPESFMKQIMESHDENIFYDAVAELSNNEIIFEGQFPFLDDITMREINFKTQKTIFGTYGYKNIEKIQNISVEIPDEGWMHSFFVLGGRFTSLKDIKDATIAYFSKKKTAK